MMQVAASLSIRNLTIPNLQQALDEARPPGLTWRQQLASIADSAAVSVLINGVGTAAVYGCLGLPPSLAVTTIYLVVGTTLGYGYFPMKKLLTEGNPSPATTVSATAGSSAGGFWQKWFPLFRVPSSSPAVVTLRAAVARTAPSSPILLERGLTMENLRWAASAPQETLFCAGFAVASHPFTEGVVTPLLRGLVRDLSSPEKTPSDLGAAVGTFVERSGMPGIIALLSLVDRPSSAPATASWAPRPCPPRPRRENNPGHKHESPFLEPPASRSFATCAPHPRSGCGGSASGFPPEGCHPCRKEQTPWDVATQGVSSRTSPSCSVDTSMSGASSSPWAWAGWGRLFICGRSPRPRRRRNDQTQWRAPPRPQNAYFVATACQSPPMQAATHTLP